ncbi:PQQ-binding-like beta-propeller repeat protein [bacterium]|nr:PQQ-binding-like beta-propeller repeat protein [bacterium]
MLMLIFASLFVLSSLTESSAENWPCWRGPRGDGTSLEEGIPTAWNGETGQNIRWKVELPGSGHSSPVIWDDRIFVAACLEDSQERILLCLDRHTGRTLWQQTVLKSPLETKHTLNSYASSTPATDGKLVFVSFLQVDGSTVPAPNVGKPRPITPGEMVVAAYDFDGQLKWKVKPGEFVSAHGYCSNPVLYRDTVIVNGDHDGNSYIVALNRDTGKTVWKQKRANGIRSYVTPLIRDINGRTQMVLSGSEAITSFNPDDGSVYWTVDGPTEQFVASMVYDGSYFFMAAGFPTHHVVAVKPDGSGNVTETHIKWHSTDAKCYVPSPVLCSGLLFVADDRGTGSAFDAKTGEKVWRDRMGNHFSTSLITNAGKVFFVADDGVTKIVDPGTQSESGTPEIIAENPLGESTYASPAIAHGSLFIRGEKHLFCIGETSKAN